MTLKMTRQINSTRNSFQAKPLQWLILSTVISTVGNIAAQESKKDYRRSGVSGMMNN